MYSIASAIKQCGGCTGQPSILNDFLGRQNTQISPKTIVGKILLLGTILIDFNHVWLWHFFK